MPKAKTNSRNPINNNYAFTHARLHNQHFPQNRIDCVLIPIVSREIKILPALFSCWLITRNELEKYSKNVAILITLPNAYSSNLHSEILHLVKLFEIDKIFKHATIEFLNIPTHEDIYIRHDLPIPDAVPPMGLKSGPNTQFFRSIALCKNFQYTILHELDMLPVTGSWLDILNRNIEFADEFWVLGAKYRGSVDLGAEIIDHINGNAIYATSNVIFQEFVEHVWIPGIKDMVKRQPDTAYDIWFERHYHNIRSNEWHTLSEDDRASLLNARDNFKHTKLISNLSADGDYLQLEDIPSLQAVLVHSRQAMLAIIVSILARPESAALKAVHTSSLLIALRSLKFYSPAICKELLQSSPPFPTAKINNINNALNKKITLYKKSLSASNKSFLDPLIPIQFTDEINHDKFLKTVINSALLSESNADIWPLIAQQNWTFDFLIHHGIYQNSVFNYGVLTGNEVFHGSNEIRQNSKTSFYHVLSIFVSTPDYTPPRLYQDRLHREIANNHEPSSFSCNLLRSTDSNQVHATWLHIVSGKTHESCLINLSSYHACFTYDPSTRQPSPHLKELVRLSIKQLRPTLEYKFSTNSKWKAEANYRHAFCPVTTRPFLAINDYMVAISSSINGNALNKVTLFDVGYKTFLDYSKILFTGTSYEGYIDFVSLDEANEWLQDDMSWFHVPTSLESNQSHWQALIQTASSIKTPEKVVNSHLVELKEILQCDPCLLNYSLTKSDINLAEYANNGFIIVLDLAAEKRSWLDQLAAYKLIIEHQRLKSKNILICIDGSTKWILEGRLEDYILTTKVGESYLELIDSLDETLTGVLILPIFGLDYLTKCYFYSLADYFVAQLGTASIGPSRAFNRFGRLIGPRSIMESPYNSLYSSNAILTEPSLVVNVSNDSETLSWDMISYRVNEYGSLIDQDLMQAAGY